MNGKGKAIVVNVHWAHATISAAAEAKDYIYCGRYSNGIGEWGNKYSHKPSNVPGVVIVATRAEAIERHREDTLANPALMAKIKQELVGKVLGCWCHPAPCHCDTLAAIANGELG